MKCSRLTFVWNRATANPAPAVPFFPVWFSVAPCSEICISSSPPKNVWMLTQINFITLTLHTLFETWLFRGQCTSRVCICVYVCVWLCVWWDILERSRKKCPHSKCWIFSSLCNFYKVVIEKIRLNIADLWNYSFSLQEPQLSVVWFS